MRLTADQQIAIRQTTTEIFGIDTEVFLFGSRLDDSAKGGDIDLLVKSPHPIENVGILASRLAARIQMKIGERKIDVLYIWPGMKQRPVHEIALEQGIPL